ncbi:MAG: UDP-glucose/GDP-mannose dehydrogenase family protein [Candidatus Gracilibacteria bacterium]
MRYNARMKITVIGTGYVGIVTAACLAEIGHEVLGIDKDTKKIEILKKGEIPIYEPELKELVNRNQKKGKLHFETDFKKGMEFGEMVINAVGTPEILNLNGPQIDLNAIYDVALEFGKFVSKKTLFVNKSTVPVGTTEVMEGLIRETLKKRGISNLNASKLFSIVHNPEFLREGTAIEDFLKPYRIVVGVNASSARLKMKKLYEPILKKGYPILFTDLRTAEMIKYASNAFLATKVSFINEMANFCELSGADIREVEKGMKWDPRIGQNYLKAGIGYGGSCLPKDVRSLIQQGENKKYEFKLLKAVDAINIAQPLRLIQKIKGVYPILKGLKIAIWGVTFKPETDDLREAPGLQILSRLLEEGAEVRVFDPKGMEKLRKTVSSKNIFYMRTPEEALKGADALLVLTEWDAFKKIPLNTLKKQMKNPVLIDARNFYDKVKVKREGIDYVGIGNDFIL